MSSRFYVPRTAGVWPGVCEVPDGQRQVYLHHMFWPERTDRMERFPAGTYDECVDPVKGYWLLMMDTDMLVDEGL